MVGWARLETRPLRAEHVVKHEHTYGRTIIIGQHLDVDDDRDLDPLARDGRSVIECEQFTRIIGHGRRARVVELGTVMSQVCSPVPASSAHEVAVVLFVMGVAICVGTATLTWLRDLTPDLGRWWLDHLGVGIGYVLGSCAFIASFVTWSTPC